MTFLLSLLPPLAWLLVLFTLTFSVSYLYIKNKNFGKVAIGILFALALIGGASWGYHLAENQAQQLLTQAKN